MVRSAGSTHEACSSPHGGWLTEQHTEVWHLGWQVTSTPDLGAFLRGLLYCQLVGWVAVGAVCKPVTSVTTRCDRPNDCWRCVCVGHWRSGGMDAREQLRRVWGRGSYQVSMESLSTLASTKRRRWRGRSLVSRCSLYGETWPGVSLGVQWGPRRAQRSVPEIQRWTAGVGPWPVSSRPCIEALNRLNHENSLSTRWGYISDPARPHDGESRRIPPPSAGTTPGLRAPLVACVSTGWWEASGARATPALISLSGYKF